MALDEQQETDYVYEYEGFKYLVDKTFMDKVKPIKVDFLNVGFNITSAVDFSSKCKSSCSVG